MTQVSGSGPLNDLHRTQISFADLMRDIGKSVNRRPSRTVLTALGTALGVATAVATVGMVESAQASVSHAFNSQLATQITFLDGSPSTNPQVLTPNSLANLERLNGVVDAGVMWQINGGQALAVGTSSTSDLNGTDSDEMPVTAVSPAALKTMEATVSDGRLIDQGDAARRVPVALLGAPAASELGIANVRSGPMIFIGSAAFTVIGIVRSVSQQNQALLGVMIPTTFSPDIGSVRQQRMVIANTDPGAAPLIAAQGVVALSPDDPTRLDVQVPPQPDGLKQQVSSSVSDLLLFMFVVVFIVGVVAIGNTTLFAVLHRRREIGIRRALGATPRHIGLLIVGEAVLVGIVGGIVGTSIGVLAIEVASLSKGWTPILDWKIVLVAPLLGIVAGGLAGAYPAFKASRVSPLTALRGSA
jgi:putative ABC transport system permease protein